MIGGVIQGLIALNVESYVPRPYHATLLAMAVVAFAIIFNTVLAVRLPLIEGTVLILHVAGLFAVIIPLWVMAPRGNARDTLLVFTNSGGWPSTGLAALIGMTSVVGTLVGYDCSVHMCKQSLSFCSPTWHPRLTQLFAQSRGGQGRIQNCS